MAAVPSPRKAIGARPGHSAVVRILLLAAFLIQSVFVQSHVHAAPLAAPAVLVAATPADESSHHGQGDASTHCFACWEAAVAGQFVLPLTAELPPPPPPAGWDAPRFGGEFGLGKSAHGWLSRAPPQ